MAKSLQEKSDFNDLDIDRDGIVSDRELAIVEAHDNHRKYKVQERIVIATAIAMFVFTLTMFFMDNAKITAMAGLSNLFYVSGGGIIAAFFGFQAIKPRK